MLLLGHREESSLWFTQTCGVFTLRQQQLYNSDIYMFVGHKKNVLNKKVTHDIIHSS